jgi:U3 small nucleolar RNA-associated protein 4
LDHSEGEEKAIEREVEREGEVEEQGGGDVEMVDDSSKTPSGGASARRKGGKTRQLVTVQRLAVSPDGQWLASSDDRRRVHIFNLDSIKVRCSFPLQFSLLTSITQHHTTLPSLPHLPTTLTFDPLSPSTLYIGLANNTIQIFDVETRLFPEWSLEVCRNLPRRLTGLADPVMGLVFSGVAVGVATGAGERKGSKEVVAWGTSWMCKISLISSSSSQHGSYGLTSTAAGGKKRPREREAGQSQTQNQNPVHAHSGTGEKDELEVINRYRNILFVDYLTPKEMVIVERPIVDVLRELPPAYFRHKYGS